MNRANHGMNQFYDRTKPALEHSLLDKEAADAIFNRDKQWKPKEQVPEKRIPKIKEFFEALKPPKPFHNAESQLSKHNAPPFRMHSAGDNEKHRNKMGIFPALRERWSQLLSQKPLFGGLDEHRRKRDVVRELMAKKEDADSKRLDTLERHRKHCPTCGCSVCGMCRGKAPPSVAQYPQELVRPPYVEYVRGERVPYPSQMVQQGRMPPSQQMLQEPSPQPPRYVFDQMGHRYLERNGNLQLVPPQEIVINEEEYLGVIQAQPQPYNYLLEDIINQNRKVIKDTNLEGGHLASNPLEVAIDAIEFVHDFTQPQKSSHSQEFELPPLDYQPPQMPPQMVQLPAPTCNVQPQFVMPPPNSMRHQYPNQMAKRSFSLTPVLKGKQDGSVLVKISPKTSLRKQKPIHDDILYSSNDVISGSYNQNLLLEDGPVQEISAKEASENKPFEIVTINNNSPASLDATDEDYEVLRYIYESHTKRKLQEEKDASDAAARSRNNIRDNGDRTQTENPKSPRESRPNVPGATEF